MPAFAYFVYDSYHNSVYNVRSHFGSSHRLDQNATKEQRATVTVWYTHSSLDFDDVFTFVALNNIPFYAVYASNLSSETITSLSPWTLVEANHYHPPTSVVG